MYNAVLTIHVIIVIALIGMILIQRGRSGGLVESLGGVESIFGTKTSAFFVKLTVILAICFFLTSISLAYLSKKRGRSLMGKYESLATGIEEESVSVSTPDDTAQAPAAEAPVVEEPVSPQKSSPPTDEPR